MMLKTHFWYLRRSFEKFIETKLEEELYTDTTHIDLEHVLICPTQIKSWVTFCPKEVELVIKELEKKGYKVNATEPKEFIKDQEITTRNITIYL